LKISSSGELRAIFSNNSLFEDKIPGMSNICNDTSIDFFRLVSLYLDAGTGTIIWFSIN